MPAFGADKADWLWLKLRRTFPSVLAACLMPDHIHLLLAPGVARDLSRRLGGVLSGFARRARAPGYWAPVGTPTVVPNIRHLRRTVRYIHMNPWREGLVADPLCWPWSTHRDAIGARYIPWLEASALAASLGWGLRDFPRFFHRYTVTDRDYRPDRLEFPTAHRSVGVPGLSPADVAAAVRASGLYLDAALSARLLAHVARAEGWPVARFSEFAGRTPRTMQRYAREERPVLGTGVQNAPPACALCLGDARLRVVPGLG